MEGFYEVTYGDEPIGKAELRRQGLYELISCRCRVTDDELYRIIAVWEDGWLNLGIPVPDMEGFVLKKSIPIKRLGENKLRFVMLNASQKPDDMLYPKQLTPDQDDEPIQKQETISCETSEEEVPAEEKSMALISEEEPFDQLPEIMNARLEIGDEGYAAVFTSDESDIQAESNGTMVGTKDVCVNGSGDNFIADPV